VEDQELALLDVDSSDLREHRREPLDRDEAAASARLQALMFGGPEPPLSTIGRYRIVRLLGRGGMGEVYEAVDTQLERTVALKVLLGGDLDPRRLRREAQSLAQLSDPHIVGVYDVGEHEEGGRSRLHLVLEYVQGVTLDAWVHNDKPDWRGVLDVMISAGRGLCAAHNAGIIHRDFKPGNVLIDGQGAPRILDFGLACAPGQPSPATMPDDSVPFDRLTVTGTVLGTPAYMAPEQHAGEATDERSDQYSFCITLYEALFAKRPFQGRSFSALVEAKLDGDPRWPLNSGIPPQLKEILVRGLSVEPSARYPTMESLVGALHRVRHPRRWRAWTLGGGVLGLALLGATALGGEAVGASACSRLVVADHGDPSPEDLAGAFERAGDYGRQTWARVEGPLGDYDKDLRASIAHWCDADRAHALESASAHACLAARRERLTVLRGALVAPDTEVLAQAVVAVRDLPPIEACSNPAGEPDAEALGEHQAALVRTDALLQAGRYSEALEQLTQLESELPSDMLRSQAMAQRGSALRRLGHAAEAVEALESAFYLAHESGAERVAFSSAIEVGFTLAYQLDALERAAEWIRHAEAAIARFDATPREHAELLKNRGVVRHLAGSAAAQHDLEEALALFEASDPTSPGVVDALQALATLHSGRGELDKGLELSKREVRLRVEAFGSEHPSIALSLHTRGVIRARLGQTAAALDDLREALRIRRLRLAPNHADIASSLGTVAALVLTEGDYEEAKKLYTEAHDVATASGKDSEARKALMGLGVAAFRSGDHDAAIRRYHQVVESAREAEDGAVDEVYARGNLANTLATRGRLDDARQEILRAAQAGEKIWGSRSSEVARLRSSRAQIELLAGHLDLAKTIAIDASRDASAAGDPVTAREIQLVHAQVELAQGATERARSIARDVLEAAKTAGDQPNALGAKKLLDRLDGAD